MLAQLAIGAAAGILVGCFFVWLVDRRHQATIKKLVESRKKIERQRTQAVNDLFAYRSGERPDGRSERRPPSVIPAEGHLARENSELHSEVVSLRTLIARADGALTAARRKRDEHEAEIMRLKAAVNSLAPAGSQGPITGNNVIDFPDRPFVGSGPANGGVALP